MMKTAIQGDIGQALFGITKQTSGLFQTKPVREIIQGFAGNRGENPMEVKFREAGNIGKLSQLHRAMQIPAKIIGDPVDSLGVLASLGIVAINLGLCGWHGDIVA